MDFETKMSILHRFVAAGKRSFVSHETTHGRKPREALPRGVARALWPEFIDLLEAEPLRETFVFDMSRELVSAE